MLLVIITFFTSIQYVFLAGVPSSVSDLSFMFITSLIGFIILFLVFFNELFRLDRSHVFQSFVLAIQIFAFNFFLLLGVDGIDTIAVSGIISSYFAFIPIIEFILYKTKPKINVIIAIIISLFGVFTIIGLNPKSFLNIKILFLLLADISISLYIITTGNYARNSNPAILSMGQLFFVTIFAFVGWFIEAKITHRSLSFPREPLFWGSVIFISFFIRGLYTVIQVYAQRYVSAINVSLIFATEIVMTLFLSGTIARYFGYMQDNDLITPTKCLGALMMVLAILICDDNVYALFTKALRKKNV